MSSLKMDLPRERRFLQEEPVLGRERGKVRSGVCNLLHARCLSDQTAQQKC